jgi:hypothetical protein
VRLAWIVTADTIWLESGSRWRRHSVQHREAGVGGEPLDLEASGTPDGLVRTETGLEMGETYLHAGTNLVFRPI